MQKKLVKIIRDEDGNITDYRVRHTVKNAKHKPRGGDWLLLDFQGTFIKPVVELDEDGKPQIVEAPDTLLKEQLQALYDDMVTDIYNRMEQVFGTKSDMSALAYAATWEAMVKRPNKYRKMDLGFETVQEVLDYAQPKLEAADAYGVYRLKRLLKYERDKNAILNP